MLYYSDVEIKFPVEFNYFCSVDYHDIAKHINQIGEGVPIHETFNPVFWSLMLFNIIVIALVQTLNPGYLNALFDTAIRNRQLINKLREDLNPRKFSAIILNFTYFTSLAVIVWMALRMDNNIFILIIAFSMIILALSKLILMALISVLTNQRLGVQEHLINHLIFYQVGGVVLTPILIFTHYVSDRYVNLTLIIFASLVGLFLIVREFQSLVRAIQYKISVFYIILYLCTLELLPLTVGIRVFILNNEVLN